jgi:hypothetical protein
LCALDAQPEQLVADEAFAAIGVLLARVDATLAHAVVRRAIAVTEALDATAGSQIANGAWAATIHGETRSRGLASAIAAS